MDPKIQYYIQYSIILYTHYDVYKTRTVLQNYSNFSQMSIAKSMNAILGNIFLIYIQERIEK